MASRNEWTRWIVESRVRELRRSLSAAYRPGTRPVNLDRLVSPLRYDVLVRQRFLEGLRDDWATYAAAPDAFADAAVGSDYFVWFREIAAAHARIPAHDERRVHEAFRRRVHRSARLLERFLDRGFDPTYRITIRVDGPQLTDTGKVLGGRPYPLDGCHRLALLRMTGTRDLDPEAYRVLLSERPPMDNTDALLRSLRVTTHEYYAFVSLGYIPGQSCTTRAGLLDAVRRHCPDALTEVRNILDRDERWLRR